MIALVSAGKVFFFFTELFSTLLLNHMLKATFLNILFDHNVGDVKRKCAF